MTWVLTKVTRLPHPKDGLNRLLMSVAMEFSNIDGSGGSVDSHIYTEPNVSDVSEEGIARLAADQMRQLEVISATPEGVIGDISGIKALVNERLSLPQAAKPTEQEIADQKETQSLQAKLSRIQVMKQLQEQGLLSDDRSAELEKLCTEVKTSDVEKILPQLAASEAVGAATLPE